MNIPFAVALTFLLHTAVSGSRIVLSLFAIHLQATPFTVGVLMSLLALLPMLFSVRTGRLLDRIGVYRPMLAAALAVVFATALAVLFPYLEALFAVSVILGSGFMLFHIAIHHAIGMTGVAMDRVRNFSMLSIAFALASFVGPLSVGFLIDSAGHRWAFLVMMAIGASAVALMLACRFEVAHGETHRKPQDERRVGDLLRDPLLRRVFVIAGVLSMTWDMFSFVIPIHGTQIGLSASRIGLVLGAMGAATIIVRMIMPFFLSRMREWPTLLISLSIAAAMFAIAPMVHSAVGLGCVAFMLGLGLGITQPMIMALLYGLAPPGRGGEAVGIRSTLLTSSHTIIPLFFGALGGALGMAPAFWMMAACLAATVYYVRVRPQQRANPG